MTKQSDPTTEEMLNYLRIAEGYEPSEKDRQINDAICRLIKNSDKGPEVDEGFVEKWIHKIVDSTLKEGTATYNPKEFIRALRQAGVRVKEAADE